MTVYTHDLTIFVLTYNRAALLRETLKNLVSQSVRCELVVFDNHSKDDTGAVVSEFASSNVCYKRADANLGSVGNFEWARSLARRRWTMVAHDDDLLHPDYVRIALSALEANPNAAMYASGMTFEAHPRDEYWGSPTSEVVKLNGAGELASILYRDFPLHFGSVIYRTDFLKQVAWGQEYGKVGDRPLLLDVAMLGEVLIQRRSLVRYRVHGDQDSQTPGSGPFVEQLAALHRKFRDHLGASMASDHGWAFVSNNLRHLIGEARLLPTAPGEGDRTIVSYWRYMHGHGASTTGALLLGLTIGYPVYWLRRCSNRFSREIRSLMDTDTRRDDARL